MTKLSKALSRLALAMSISMVGAVAMAGSDPALASAQPAVSQPRFSSDRVQIEVRGQGPDILLIPGLASTSAVWEKTAAALEGRYRLHLVTLRGFGALEPQANGRGAISGPVAEELARYLRENRLNRTAVIGHSMGGQIAIRLAAMEQARVSRVMVVDSSPFFPSLISPGATSSDVEPLARLVYQGLILFGDEALRSQAQAAGVELGGASDSLFNSLGWQGGDRRTLAQGLYEVMITDLRASLPSIQVPVTVVYGWSPDSRSPRAQVDDLFRNSYTNLPNPARFERIEGAEHMVMVDQPRRFQEAVERFLTGRD